MSHSSSFPILATGALVRGDRIRFTEAVYSYDQYLGPRTIEARVVRDTSRNGKQPGAFTLTVLHSDGVAPPIAGSTLRRDAGIVFRHGVYRAIWRDERARESRRAGRGGEDLRRFPRHHWMVQALLGVAAA